MLVVSFDVGLKNLAYCVLRVDPTAQLEGDTFPMCWRSRVAIKDWKVVCAVDEKHPSMDEVCEGVYSRLDDIIETCGLPDRVLIENQPVLKNPLMKTVQVMIYSYWKMIERTSGHSIDVMLVNASLKTTGLLPARGTQSYRDRKKASVAAVEEWLPRDAGSKKDDLADCLLQALQVLARESKN